MVEPEYVVFSKNNARPRFEDNWFIDLPSIDIAKGIFVWMQSDITFVVLKNQLSLY